jgi:nucleoid DNA-binding protein
VIFSETLKIDYPKKGNSLKIEDNKLTTFLPAKKIRKNQ